MTSAMWFAWLLRDDIRQGAEVQDQEAQREFVAWWLLCGRREYPAVWDWGRPQAVVAMQLVPLIRGLSCPRLLRRVHSFRADLQRTFSLEDKESLAEFLSWYRVYGPRELDAAPQLPKACVAMTEAPSRRPFWSTSGIQVPRVAVTLAQHLVDLSSVGSSDGALAARFVADWYENTGRGLLAQPTPPPAPRVAAECGKRVSGGVNLVGFVRGQFGLGEDVRTASAALDAVGIPYALFDVPAPQGVRQQDSSLAHLIADRLRYEISIYCMSGFDMAGLYLDRGAAFFGGQYRIGYWPWELPRFPAVWNAAYALVDEIWAGSQFTAHSYRELCTKPVLTLPCPVIVPEVKPSPRKNLGLPREPTFVFTYPFDANSHIARKNPLGVVRAFRRAFPPADRNVALLLRVNGDPEGRAGWTEVASACRADRRIIVMTGTFDRQAALGMLAASDCLVSPHRAEGFGRNIAEAILLGVPVLATGFSGCLDFLAPEERIPVRLVPLRGGDYPFGEGLYWAEPSITAMASRMRQVRERSSQSGTQRLARRRTELEAAYNPLVTGRAFAARLNRIERLMARGSL